MAIDPISGAKLNEMTDEFGHVLRSLKFEVLQGVLKRLFETFEAEGFSVGEVFSVLPFALNADSKMEDLLLAISKYANEIDFSIADSTGIEI